MAISNVYTPPKTKTDSYQPSFGSFGTLGGKSMLSMNKPKYGIVGASIGAPVDPNSVKSSALTSMKQPEQKPSAMFNAPSTPLKSVTANPDGTQVATYHAPTTDTKKTTTKTPTSPTPLNFPGLVGGLSSVSSNAVTSGANNYQSANQGLINATKQNQEYADRARQIADNAGQQISSIGQIGARTGAGYRTTGTSPVGEGNAAVLNQSTAAQQQAVAAGANMQLTGNAQGLTAQQQMQSGFNQAAGLGLQGQGQGISGLGTAVGYGQPQLGQYGQTYYNPLNAGQGGSGGSQVQPNDPFYQTLQSYAQQAATGQYSAIPSSITSNPVLNAQLNEMAKGINPSYNPVTSAAQSQVTANQVGTQAGYQSALQQGQNLQAQLTDLIRTFGLNPGDINAANIGIQQIAKNVSDPHYKQLQNYINDIANTYSQILTPPGGSATDTSRGIAASMLDATASGTSIIDTMRSLDEAAKAKIAGVQTSYGSVGSSGGVTFGWDGN